MIHFQFLLAPAIAILMTSCAGIGFESAWKKSADDFGSGKSSGVSGPWIGTWTSEHNAHTGDLRCIVTKDPESEEQHRFRYHATWGRFFRGGFNAEFPVKPDGKGYSVDGSQSLGLFGGFKHEGRIEGDAFKAKFGSAKGDYGVFEMTRPENSSPGD